MSVERKADVVSGKLDVLANRFEGFQDVLDAEQTRKIEELNKRFDDSQSQITSFGHSLKLESKNNKAQMMALKAWLEDRFKEFQKSVVDPMNEQFAKINVRCDTLKLQIERLEKKEANDIEASEEALKNSASQLTQKLNDFKRKFDESMEGIHENRKETELKLLEQERSLLSQLKDEKQTREKCERHLSETLASEEKVRAKGQKNLTEDLGRTRDLLKSLLDEESSAREQGDEKLVQALAHYTAALQDAIKKLAG